MKKYFVDPLWGVFLALGIVVGLCVPSRAEDDSRPIEPVEPIVIVKECDYTPTQVEPAEPVKLEEPMFTDEELDTLALIIYQEAGGDSCSDETRQMVGEVVLNRVADDRFPDNIVDVALQERQYGRLHWTGLVWPDRAINPGEAHAVERAFACAEELLSGKERLLPTDAIWQAEFEQGETIVKSDGFFFGR